MNFKRLLILGLLLSSKMLNAQTDFKPGYIIKNSSDTLYGMIDYRGDLLMGSICKFKSVTNDITVFLPKDITAYRFIDGKYYVAKEINGKSVFLEYLVKGKVSVYYLRDDIGDHYYIDKEGIRLSEIPYKEEIKELNDSKYFYSSTIHIGIIKTYMQDAPDLHSKIDGIKKLERRYLIELVEEYNKLYGKGQDIVYKKRQLKVNVNLELAAGLINFGNIDGLIDKNYFYGGLIAHLWMPRANEKLFFRTGLLFTSFETVNKKNIQYKIPIQIEYIYPKSIIRPKVALGINIYRSLNHSVAMMGGFDIRISKSINGSINYEIEFTPNEQIPIASRSLLAQSISTGIYIKL
jgi:hypothetical protein